MFIQIYWKSWDLKKIIEPFEPYNQIQLYNTSDASPKAIDCPFKYNRQQAQIYLLLCSGLIFVSLCSVSPTRRLPSWCGACRSMDCRRMGPAPSDTPRPPSLVSESPNRPSPTYSRIGARVSPCPTNGGTNGFLNHIQFKTPVYPPFI